MIARNETNRIIWHHSLTDGGDVESFRRYHIHINGWADVGYHFVIPKNGRFQKGRDIKLVGAHAKRKNDDSIGICLVGDFHKYEPTINQMNESLILYHELCRLFSKNLKIEYHRPQWMPNACPGKKMNRVDFEEIVYRGRI